jgi:hypothetical protein
LNLKKERKEMFDPQTDPLELPDTLESWELLAKRDQDLKSLSEPILLNRLLTEKEVAYLLAVSEGWVQERRLAGKRPFYLKIGEGNKAPVRYDPRELITYLDSCQRTSTSQQEAH